MGTLGLLWVAISWVLGSSSAWVTEIGTDESSVLIAGAPADGHCG